MLVTQSCLTLCVPVDCSLPSSSVHGILQEEYWRGLPFPSPGDLPNPGIEPKSPALWASLVVQLVKNLPAVQETEVQSLGQEDPMEKEMATHSSILPGEFHGQRSLEGYSPQGCKQLDTTEASKTHVSSSTSKMKQDSVTQDRNAPRKASHKC